MAEVKDNPDRSRYEIFVDGERVGLMTYSIDESTVTTPHTEIDASHGGQGLGQQLVREALNHIRDTGMSVKPACPFVRAFIDNHPDFRDLVKEA